MLDQLTHHDFAKHLDSTFTVAIGGKKTQKWRLVEAKDVRSGGGTARRQAFSLLFAGPGGSPVPQGVYKLRHAKMRNMEIMVCAVAAEGDKKIHYEAVFN